MLGASKTVLPLSKLALNTILRNMHRTLSVNFYLLSVLTDLGHLPEHYKEQILTRCQPAKLLELQKAAFKDKVRSFIELLT
jgi:hypothetical protein